MKTKKQISCILYVVATTFATKILWKEGLHLFNPFSFLFKKVCEIRIKFLNGQTPYEWIVSTNVT